MSKYNTNLAAEFYVLSMLHRLGYDATITLGNKKAVDIVVALEAGVAQTIDVKGLAGKTGWPVDNVKPGRKGHFLVFVCFLDKIADPTSIPEVYVVPAAKLNPLIYTAPGGRKLVQLSTLREKEAGHRDQWRLLERKSK